MRTVILSITGALVVLMLAAAVWLGFAERPVELSPAMVNIDGADIGGPFELTSAQAGAPITSDRLIDGPTLLYFGYSFCPDICPLDVQKMAAATDILAERGIALTPVFITIDPERDTAEELADWAGAIHPDLVALTGAPEDIRAAADAFRVYYEKVEAPDSAGYLMNHTTFYYLVTPDGLAGVWRHDVTPEGLAEDIQRVLDAV